MEFLTANDIAIHVPHKIEVQFAGGMYTLRGINNNDAIFRRWWMPSVPIKHIVPLLRPLHRLTQPMIHKRSTFTPYKTLMLYSEMGHYFNLDPKILEEVIENDKMDMGKMPYWMAELCASWHFDVKGLLPRKLANHLI